MTGSEIEQVNTYDEFFILLKNNKWFDFMNHGYYPPSEVFEKNYIFKNSASLYFNIIEDLDTESKTILDIGCGRGGGVKVFKEYKKFKDIYACDINVSSIDFCKENHPGINFKTCSSTSLDYNNTSFDIVTNVESSHCYSNINLFLKEVKRVLNHDGVFCYTDVFLNDYPIEEILENSGQFKNIVSEDITDNVFNSCIDFIQCINNNLKDRVLCDYLTRITKQQAYNYLKGSLQYKKFLCYV
tara:strand:- start:86 stop:811 length:726 start_codon:yes stop_codon:yes gene_type:complete